MAPRKAHNAKRFRRILVSATRKDTMLGQSMLEKGVVHIEFTGGSLSSSSQLSPASRVSKVGASYTFRTNHNHSH